MSTKIAKSKGRKETPKLKVMHIVSKDENGNASITSRTVPKLKAAVGPDVQQAAEETGHKVPKTVKPKEAVKPKSNGELSKEQRAILQALESLGGKDIDSMTIAKRLHFDKGEHAKAPRAPVRSAMEQFEKLGFAKRERKGVKWLFSITDKGKALLEGKNKGEGGLAYRKHGPDDVPDSMLDEADRGKKANRGKKRKMSMSGSELQQAIENETREEAAGLGPASNPSTTSTEGIECPWCKTRNPTGAEFCKECGRKQREAVQAEAVAA